MVDIEVLEMPRGSGKTTLLIKESAKTGRPIITDTINNAKNISDMANDMGLRINEPISASRWVSGGYNSDKYRIDKVVDEFIVDDVDNVLRCIFGKPIGKATYTPKELKAPNSDVHNCSLNNEGKMYFNMNGLQLRTDSNGTLECYLGSDFGWIPINSKDKEEKSRMSNSYNLKDFGYFSADVYEAMKRCIKDINVIVPNKVVEITFCDNEKEKMVCHEEDTFDLRRCCFIAIAKHLYKKDYTYEGIEYMAGQLMYQKAFVKTVDQALKKCKKKLADKEKAEKNEAEKKDIRERQAEKKRRYKARRAQRYKAEMVDLIADSINEAKERRNS